MLLLINMDEVREHMSMLAPLQMKETNVLS